MKIEFGDTRLPQRFWDKVKVYSTCWDWMGYRNIEGYGQFKWNNVTSRAHRVIFQELVGLIPDGLYVDHMCNNKSCVNPSHLEAVTHEENMKRHYKRLKLETGKQTQTIL